MNDTIAMLREAVAVGFTDAKGLRSEVLLGPIRGCASFRGLFLMWSFRGMRLCDGERCSSGALGNEGAAESNPRRGCALRDWETGLGN